MFTLPSRSSRAQRDVLLGFMILGVLTLWVMVQVEAPMLLGMRPDWDRKIAPYSLLLHLHAAASMFALLAGPALFLPSLRLTHPNWHRRMGYLYASLVAVASPLGIWIAFRHLPPGDNLSNVVAGVIWLLSTGAAVLAAVQRRIVTHQRWVYRSYAMATTFVVSRMLYDVAGWHVPESLGGNTSALWIYTLLALVIAELLPLQVPEPSIPVAAQGMTTRRTDDGPLEIARDRGLYVLAPGWSVFAGGVLLLVATTAPSAVLLFATTQFSHNPSETIANGQGKAPPPRTVESDPQDVLYADPLSPAPFFIVGADSAAGTMAAESAERLAARAGSSLPNPETRTLPDAPGADFSIIELQERLKSLGFDPGAVDGRWGPQTRRALERLQRQEGLGISGRIDAATAAVLRLDDGVNLR
nr:DUF2306 domain-containing protein [Thiocapsa sp.]